MENKTYRNFRQKKHPLFTIDSFRFNSFSILNDNFPLQLFCNASSIMRNSSKEDCPIMKGHALSDDSETAIEIVQVKGM